MSSAFMPRSRRMNASAGSTSPSANDTARGSPRPQHLGREREVGDPVGGLVTERHLAERVLGRVDDVVADDARGGARGRADDEDERLAETVADRLDRLLGLDCLRGRHRIGEHRAGAVAPAAATALETRRRLAGRSQATAPRRARGTRRRDPFRLPSPRTAPGRPRAGARVGVGAVERIRRDAGRDPKREAGVREPVGEHASGSGAPSASAASAPAPGSMTTNSSPPRRAASAPSGSARARTSATSRRSASPNSCPARSLISLKSSQSMTRRLSGMRRSCATASARSSRSSRPRRLRIRVSGSVTALSRSRWSANAASSDAATCAASTAAVSSSARVDVRRRARDADERAELAGIRAERQPDDRLGARACHGGVAELEHLADDARIRLRARRLELVDARAVRCGRLVDVPDGELGRRAELVPDDDLARLDREHARERRGARAPRCRPDRGGCRDGRRVARAPARSSVRLAPERLRERCERADERPERLGGAVRERALGLDVEHADDRSADAQRDRELGDDARERGDVVGIDRDVGRELCAAEPDRAARDPALDRDPVGDDGVPALRDEPESTVLEHEDRRHDTGDRVVEAPRPRPRSTCAGSSCARRSRPLPLRGSSQQPGVDRPDDTRSRRGTLHALVYRLSRRRR